MEMCRVLLKNNNYHDFLNGFEVEGIANLSSAGKRIQAGDHVMVYKDSVASTTDLGVPTREKLSDYIGIEATVTEVKSLVKPDTSTHPHLKVKKV